MYDAALPYLHCPRHPNQPLLLREGAERAVDGAILTGTMDCPTCSTQYPIREGMLDLLGSRYLPTSPAQVTNLLPLTAWAYERTWRPQALSLLSGESFGYERELTLITTLAAPARGGLLVDVACSNGLYARALAQALGAAPGHVIGVDHAWPMLQQARAYAQAQRLPISFVRTSAQALPFAEGSASALVMGGSLNEIGDAPQALRELRRTMASTGRVALMSLVRGQRLPGQVLQQALGLGGISFPKLADLNHMLAAADLRLRGQWQYGVVVFSLLTQP
ncbi:MAG: class I SAM-dependent methyltransferase [Oscillochloridaceae bacterium umkhey_bin13]